MTLKTFTILSLSALWLSGCAPGYRDMINDFESYRPPAYFRPPHEAAPPPEPSPEENAFRAEKKRIEAAAARWEQALRQKDPKTAFFRPEAELMAALEPASRHADLPAKILEKTVSLEDLEALVLIRNPDIKAAESRFRATIQSLRQVTALDEILRRYTAFTEDLNTGVGPMKGKDPVNLKFPFPGILALKGEIAQQEVRAAREDLEITRRDMLTSARVAFWNLLFNRKARQTTAETLDLLKHLEEAATARYEAGRTSFQDVIKVRIKRDILEQELTTLREKKRNIETEILGLLNLPPSVSPGDPKERKPSGQLPSPETLYDTALEKRQELRRLRAAIGKMERMIEMAETMILPPFTLNLSLYEDQASEMVGPGATRETFPVSVSPARGKGVPKKPWFGTGEAYLVETREKLRARRRQLEGMEKQTVTLVRKAWFELDRAVRDESLYKDRIVKQARAAMDVSTRGYEAGNVSFADVISSYTLWLDASLALHKKRSELGIARAELERTVGTNL